MPKIRQLSPEENKELDQYMVFAMELVPIVEDIQEEGFLIVASHLLIDSLRDGAPLPDGVSFDDVATWLGVLWAEELCRLSAWRWLYMTLDNGFEGVCVTDSESSRVCFPIHLIYSWLCDKEKENDCMGFFAKMCKGQSLTKNAFVVMG